MPTSQPISGAGTPAAASGTMSNPDPRESVGDLRPGRLGDADGRAHVSEVRFPLFGWLLAVLIVVLLPPWIRGEMEYRELGDKLIPVPVLPVLRASFTPWLPVAMALLVGLRAGVLNLSVWGSAAVGAAVCWLLSVVGLAFPLAALTATAVGGSVGYLQGRFSGRSSLRSAGASIVVGGVLMAVGSILAGVLAPMDPEAIDGFCRTETRLVMIMVLYGLGLASICAGWRGVRWLLEFVLGVLALVALYAMLHRRAVGEGDSWDLLRLAAMLTLYGVLLWASRARFRRRGPLWPSPPRLWACVLGGGLAAGAGCMMFLAGPDYVPSGSPVADLRVVAAVVLCGGWCWRGWSGSFLTGLLLPGAMLAATMWMQMIGPWFGGVAGHGPLGMLIVMVGGMHLVSTGRGYRMWRRLAGWATAIGVVIVALGAYCPANEAAIQLALAGMTLWTAGMVAGGYRFALRRRSAAAKSK